MHEQSWHSCGDIVKNTFCRLRGVKVIIFFYKEEGGFDMSVEELMKQYEEQCSDSNQESSSYLCYSDYDD